MSISVVYNNKVYFYKNVGKYTTWVDLNEVIVPTMFHSKLRELAISNGTDSSAFVDLNIKKLDEIEKVEVSMEQVVKSKKSKSNLTNIINPFEME